MHVLIQHETCCIGPFDLFRMQTNTRSECSANYLKDFIWNLQSDLEQSFEILTDDISHPLGDIT